MNILALNPGSGTLQYKLVAITPTGGGPDGESIVRAGKIDHVHGDATVEAAGRAIDDCRAAGIDAVAYRVVHGGLRFDGPALVTPEVAATIRGLADLAPLHNPIDLRVIEAGMGRLPGVPAVAVFDSAWHRTLPEVAWRYALPDRVGANAELRRYGFHGIAHRYATGRLLECLGRPAAGTRLILAHLGGGASLCAVRDGRSVDTTMGLTPLGGLVMSTRSGDLDPGLILHLLRARGMTPDELEHLLAKESGLLGVSGRSDDLRDLEPAAAGGDARAKLALDVQAYRIRKAIGAYAAVLGGVDAIALHGAQAENSAGLRGRVLDGLEFLGIHLDEARNRAAGPEGAAPLTTAESSVPAWLVPADEEVQMAREAVRLQHGA